MLVEPVGHERADDPLLPPGRRPHLAHPGRGDVPVVVDVVVVEDHRARHGREQPADVGIAPRLAVEPRVLLEVGDLLARRAARVAARADEGARLPATSRPRRPGRRAGAGSRATAPARTAAAARAPRARRSRSRRDAASARACTAGAPGAPTRQEPKTRRARRSCSRVWIVDGGRPSSGGQTRSPSSATSYGARSPRRDRSARRARSGGPRRGRCADAHRGRQPRTLRPSRPRRSPACCRCSAGAARERDLA